jgi:ElaB/YqjD/DUF883 family membrane-anchored ribosome-binding protein
MYKTKGRTKRSRHDEYDLYADLERIKNAFSDTASDVRGKTGEILSSTVQDIREKSVKARDGMADYTAERPFKSLGAALLIGVALGYFIKR